MKKKISIHKRKKILNKIKKIEKESLQDDYGDENVLDHMDSVHDELEIDEDLKDKEEDDEEEEDDTPFYEVSAVKKKTVKPPKEKFYVEPKKFDDEIVSYYESGVLTNDLAEMINKIAHKLSYAPNFINYTYREDMVGDALIRMFKALMSKKYDREKGTNPFSYFTRIAFNAFRNRIKKEKHMTETHQKYQSELLLMSENYNNFTKNNKSSSFDKIFND